jgi:predicted methyltransferase
MVIRELKTPCSRCQGTGRLAGLTSSLGIPQINASGVCPACKGRGFVLTELGQDLLNLLRPFVEDWIAEREAGTSARRPGSPPAPSTP